MRYLRPNSLTWWAGVFLIAMGFAQAAGLPAQWQEATAGLSGILQAMTGALAALTGAGGDYATPGQLIATGVGMIGLRDALVRNEDAADERMALNMQAMQHARPDAAFGDATFDDMLRDPDDDLSYDLPDGESPMPPGVRDPYGPGGSRE
jgi:hypothetical protein